ncbi:protein of unknown function [Pseudomonas sp. JV551A1]|uniref:Uncharacterized protein n=1 Tax=Pseudomonas inefficax TaxID=2078786 RepID=A0AAQ1P9J5_9PSED|nr:protein of unknown function [Pseudomonas sp. JV551A1]SPO61712.1 protein of unknown function [Pseudomonas inefficax]
MRWTRLPRRSDSICSDSGSRPVRLGRIGRFHASRLLPVQEDHEVLFHVFQHGPFALGARFDDERVASGQCYGGATLKLDDAASTQDMAELPDFVVDAPRSGAGFPFPGNATLLFIVIVLGRQRMRGAFQDRFKKGQVAHRLDIQFAEHGQFLVHGFFSSTLWVGRYIK